MSHAGRRAQQGRPLGFLFWWLKQGHQANGDVHGLNNWAPHDVRAAARREFMGLPGANSLLQLERPARPGEPDEPIECP